MSTIEISKKRYFLIDKIVVDKDRTLSFDIYAKDQERKLILVYKKNTLLKKETAQSLIARDTLYVYEREKLIYEREHKEFMNKKVWSDKMYTVYEDVRKSVTELFKNPESLGHIQAAKENVTTMVSNILHEDFAVSSFLSILAYDYYTHTHSLNVSVYAICLGKHLGMNGRELEDLGTAALLHDIGKSKIDHEIINKDGKLTDDEFETVKKHPEYSWDILNKVGVTNRHILNGVRHHHEKVDGTGYPDRLKGDDIHQYAKIIAICDVFDALTTKRSYKEPVATFNTLLMMKKEMNNHLDSSLINRFILMFRQENDIS